MIKIVAKCHVKPEGKEEFLKLAETLVAASKAEEGNIDYALHESVQDPYALAFIEVWRDPAAIDSHNHSEHFTTIFPQLGALCDGPDDIAVYKVLI